MKRQVIQSILILILILCPVLSHAAFDGTRPADSELLKDAPALIRANFNALKDMIDQIYTNYGTTASIELKADKSYVDDNFATTGQVALKANAAEVYTKAEIDADRATTASVALKLDASAITNYYNKTEANALLNDKADTGEVALKANAADVYDKTTADLLLDNKADTAAVALKLDASAISNYYTKPEADENFATTESVALKANSAEVYTTEQVNLMLDDKADTASVALKIGRSDTFTATLSGTVPFPGGTPSGATVLCDDGIWRGVVSVGGGVTNAVDLNVDASTFSHIINSAATNAQAALAQIEANAATTAEVAAKANSADVYTKEEADSTNEAYINSKGYATKNEMNTAIGVATAEINIGSYSDTAAMNAAIAAATAECQAKTWTPLTMANGAYTGEVAILDMAASCSVYEVLYGTSSGMNKAKADVYTTLPVIGMCVETGTGNRKVLLRGFIRNTSWSFTKGARIYCSTATAGAITAVAPSAAGSLIQIIGIATAADTIYFNPDSTCVEN